MAFGIHYKAKGKKDEKSIIFRHSGEKPWEETSGEFGGGGGGGVGLSPSDTLRYLGD